ncbi:MAG TPA: cytochrome c [Vicinamibacterales bacterium]
MARRLWQRNTLFILATLLYGAGFLSIALRAARQSPPQNPGSVAPALPATRTGEEIFRATCATCHGIDGKGSPRSVVGFEKPLPDFTDCSFATAEARPDWQAVVHEGGPIRALDHHMPAFGDALTQDDIVKVVGYIKTFCGDHAWPQGDLNFPRAFFTEKAFPEDEAVLTTGVTGKGQKAVSNDVEYERRFGSRGQLTVDVPLDFQQTAASGSWARGLGDVEFAYKQTLYSSLSQGGIVAVGGALTFPTGNPATGLGDGVRIYEPFAMFDQRLTRSSFVQLQAGFKASSDTATFANSAYLDSALGVTFASDHGFGRQWTPQVEMLWARSTGGPSDWDAVPQLQVTLSKLQHVRLAAGVRVPVTDRTGRPTQVLVYCLWDWFDGGFFQFWK